MSPFEFADRYRQSIEKAVPLHHGMLPDLAARKNRPSFQSPSPTRDANVESRFVHTTPTAGHLSVAVCGISLFALPSK